MVSKYGNDSPEFREVSAKMLNTFVMTMRGTPYIYYGDELGMTNIDFDSIEQYQDISAINGHKVAIASGEDMDAWMRELNFMSRDNGRTPMQWDDTENAGFSSGKPWLPVNENYLEINVAQQDRDQLSVLNHFRSLTELRKEHPVLVYGAYTLLLPEHEQVYAYTRSSAESEVLVVLNFNDQRQEVELAAAGRIDDVLLNNYERASVSEAQVFLEPYQAIIFSLTKD